MSNKVKKEETMEQENEKIVDIPAEDIMPEDDFDDVPAAPEEEPKKEGFFKKVGKKVQSINWKKVGKAALALVAVGGIGYLTGVAVTRHKSEDDSDNGEIPMLPEYDDDDQEAAAWRDDDSEYDDSELASTDDETVNEES